MRLGIRMLDTVSGVNNFSYSNSVGMTEGDSPTVYFQLVDLSQDRADQGFVPAGRRYIPAAGATMTVQLLHVDDARKVVKTAVQPFNNDPSIWSFTLASTDPVRGTVNMIVTLTEGAKVTKGLMQQALSVEPLDGMTRL